LRSPAGFAFRGDTIYIGTSQQIRAFLDTDSDAKADTSWTFFDDIPQSEHPYEWTTGFAFGPDGWLYFNLTTDSWNAAPSPDPGLYRGAVLRISPNGKKIERVASGIRSVHSMAFNEHGDLFFTDNEGGGNPTEELNRLVVNGFYGHNPNKYKPGATTVPEYVLEMEVAPSGLTFNKGDNDFGGAAGNLFVTYYGPGERWTRGAVSRLQLERSSDRSYKYQEFRVADIPKLSDLAFGADGNLYLAQHGKADYWYNVVYENQGNFYKLIYDPTITPSKKIAKADDVSFSENSIETGKQLFAEQACLGCHQVDGVTELLGPNLKDVAKRLSREEILEEILKPSERIKPSMIAQRVTKKDGQILIGRVVNSDANRISLMLVGNHVVDIMRKDIQKTENEMKSLMYEGLLNGLQEDQKEALLNFIISLSN
jgi:putative heme-binding domain-containing protein